MNPRYVLSWAAPGTARDIEITAWDSSSASDAPGPPPWQVSVRANGQHVGSWSTHAHSWAEAMVDVAEYVIRTNPQ